MGATRKRTPIHSIATGNLTWVRAHQRGDSGAQVFRGARETICHPSGRANITIKYEDFGSPYCLQYLEFRLETLDTWTLRQEKFGDTINFTVYQIYVKLLTLFSLT